MRARCTASWQLRRAPTAPCTGSRAFSSALGTRTQHVASRPLVTPFGSHPHTKTPNFVVGTAEGPIASELDSSALTNSMLPRGLRHHSRSGWEDALTAASLVKELRWPFPPTSVAHRQGVIRPASSVETFTHRAERSTNAFWSAAPHSWSPHRRASCPANMATTHSSTTPLSRSAPAPALVRRQC